MKKIFAVGAVGLAIVAIVGVSGCCAAGLEQKHLDPMAAAAPDMAGLVAVYIRRNPDEAQNLDDVELVKAAAAYRDGLTPDDDTDNYMTTYEGALVRGTRDGVILVCSTDRQIAYFEDARCTPKLDKDYYLKGQAPACDFTLDVAAICP